MYKVLRTWGLAAMLAVGASAQDASDITGRYEFLDARDWVQVIHEGGKLRGYISRHNPDGDGGYLEHLFSRGSYDGHRLTFTTRSVHATWFEFDGTVQRGAVADRTHDGFLVIRGKLTRYRSDAEKKVTAESREVEWKLLAEKEGNP